LKEQKEIMEKLASKMKRINSHVNRIKKQQKQLEEIYSQESPRSGNQEENKEERKSQGNQN
jgi:hypothetical protein